jgi:drug/metabolite transporter (DMT)-like permease
MYWYALSIIGAIADAGYYISVKKNLLTADPLDLAAGVYTCTGIILLVVSWFRGFPSVGHDFFYALFASSVLGIIAVLLSYAALRQTDISLAVPMISFTPLFLIATAFVLLHEIPSLIGVAGILIIVTGSYVLNVSTSQKTWTDPFRSIARNRGVLFMLVVSFIYAIAINFDKVIVTSSDPVFGSAIACLLLGLSFAGMSMNTTIRRWLSPLVSPPADEHQIRSLAPASTLHLKTLGQWILVGILLSIFAVSINMAYTMQIVPYVIGIKRMSILIIVVYGGFVFKEENMVLRLSAALLMVVGAALIVLFN